MKRILVYSALPSALPVRFFEFAMLALLLCAPHSQAMNIGYDAAGRVIWSIQPNGHTTAFDYDSNGNIASIASVTPAEDADLDGIPDYFEIRFTGASTALVAAEDTDGDGMSHLFEFAFAKDPSVADARNITPIRLEMPDPQTHDALEVCSAASLSIGS